jgi:hypothetical protein
MRRLLNNPPPHTKMLQFNDMYEYFKYTWCWCVYTVTASVKNFISGMTFAWTLGSNNSTTGKGKAVPVTGREGP